MHKGVAFTFLIIAMLLFGSAYQVDALRRSRLSTQYRSIITTTANIAAPPHSNALQMEAEEICLRDESKNLLIQINSSTGDYQFKSCDGGITMSGTGKVKLNGCSLSVVDKKQGRNVKVKIDTCLRRGSATIKGEPLSKKVKIPDTDAILGACDCRELPELVEGATYPPNAPAETTTIQFVAEDGTTSDLEVVKGRVNLLFDPNLPPSEAEGVIRDNGGSIIAKLPGVGYYLAGVSPGSEMSFILRMRQNSSIVHVGPDLPLAPQNACAPDEWKKPGSGAPLEERSAFLKEIDAPLAWHIASSTIPNGNLREIVVGVLDSDFTDFDRAVSADFGDRLVSPGVIFDTGNPPHGTLVAALCCAGTDSSGMGNLGVNWWSRLTFRDAAGLSFSQLISYLTDLVSKGANVITISILISQGSQSPCPDRGYRVYFDALFSAVRQIRNTLPADRKFLVVQAAGNGRCEITSSVEKPDNIIIVGESQNGEKDPESGFGPLVDIAAPGEVSLLDYSDPNTFLNAHGTSFSAPLVAGAAALVWSQELRLTAAGVISLLKAKGRPGPASLGGRILNIGNALSRGAVLPAGECFNDDFEDNFLNPKLWTEVPRPAGVTGFSGIEENGHLVAIVPVGDTLSGNLTTFSLVGDFDIQVDYEIIGGAGPHSSRLAAFDLGDGQFGIIGINRASTGALDSNEEKYVMSLPGSAPEVRSRQSVSKLRLVRNGSTLSGYYRNGGQWVLVGSGTVSTGPTRLSLDLRSIRGDILALGAFTAFDNFIIKVGSVDVP